VSEARAGREPHYDVASYALGVLDDADASAFEEHLASCDACAEDLESFLPVAALLPEAHLSPADLAPRPTDAPDELADRRGRPSRQQPVPAATAIGRRGLVASVRDGLRRPLVAAAAAAVAAAGGTAAMFGTVGPHELATSAVSTGSVAPAPWNGLQGPDLGSGQQLEVSDERSGVHGQVVLDAAPYGTRISFALWQLIGPQECRLVVVRRGGGGQVVSTWTVPAAGYGRPEQPQPLVLQAATSIERSQIQAVVVESVGGGGTRPLMRVAP
jgi:Putative zinc-finger